MIKKIIKFYEENINENSITGEIKYAYDIGHIISVPAVWDKVTHKLVENSLEEWQKENIFPSSKIFYSTDGEVSISFCVFCNNVIEKGHCSCILDIQYEEEIKKEIEDIEKKINDLNKSLLFQQNKMKELKIYQKWAKHTQI